MTREMRLCLDVLARWGQHWCATSHVVHESGLTLPIVGISLARLAKRGHVAGLFRPEDTGPHQEQMWTIRSST